MTEKEKEILQRIIYVCIGLILASIFTPIKGWEIPSPDDWLVGWTSWLATVVTMVVAARVFWIGGSGLRKLINEGPFWRKKHDDETSM